MVQKTRRNIYDPALDPSLDGEFMATSGNIDDDGDAGVFMDSQYHDDPLYFDDGHMDEERQTTEILDPNLHKLQRSGRGRRMCFYFLISCVTLALIVMTSVLVKKSKSGNDRSVSLSSMELLNPPAELATICSPDNIVSSDGRKRCQDACDVSKCCSYPANTDSSCLAGNEDTCQRYQNSCGVVTGTNVITADISPAPANLGETCSMQALASTSGLKACANICMPSRCCYGAIGDDCSANENCMGYAPCHNLETHDKIDAAIFSIVNTKCQDPALVQDCKNLCLAASCCYNPFGSCTDKADPKAFCHQYDMCKNVYLKSDSADDDDLSTFEPTMSLSDGATMEPTMEPTFSSPTPTVAPGFVNDGSTTTPTMEPTFSSPAPTVAGGTFDDGQTLEPTLEPTFSSPTPTIAGGTFDDGQTLDPTLEPTFSSPTPTAAANNPPPV
ncbi:hypothetical protein MPSEU_001019800 [Mayamaea pseudoterrestris]|nr:hypothetical protein MPSEU_001019800 [Mayamaea pseudoterrestris]